jgi:hypothetical protein
MEIAVALDSSYEDIRCTTHAPVRNASGEGPRATLKFGADVRPDRGRARLALHFLYERQLSQCTKKKDPPRKNSMMAFQFKFSRKHVEIPEETWK